MLSEWHMRAPGCTSAKDVQESKGSSNFGSEAAPRRLAVTAPGPAPSVEKQEPRCFYETADTPRLRNSKPQCPTTVNRCRQVVRQPRGPVGKEPAATRPAPAAPPLARPRQAEVARPARGTTCSPGGAGEAGSGGREAGRGREGSRGRG